MHVRSNKVIFKPSGMVASVTKNLKTFADIDGIMIIREVFENIENLPQPTDNTIFIVSQNVLKAAQAMGRTDCVTPAGSIQNNLGQVIVPYFVV